MIKKLRFTPVLKVTRYDIISAAMLSLLIMLVLGNITLALMWLTNKTATPVAITTPPPIEPLLLHGPQDGGGSTLLIASPDPQEDDPSTVEAATPEDKLKTQIQQIETVAETSVSVAKRITTLSRAAKGLPSDETPKTTKPKIIRGTDKAKTHREPRWFLEVTTHSLKEYARILDHFKIELGALTPDGKLTYLSKVSQPTPKVRTVRSGANEKRTYFMAAGTKRRIADLELFRNADIDASKAIILQFIPSDVEAQMEKLELQKGATAAKDIRRTYFRIKTTKTGYKFEVTRQLLRR